MTISLADIVSQPDAKCRSVCSLTPSLLALDLVKLKPANGAFPIDWRKSRLLWYSEPKLFLKPVDL